MVSGKIKTDLNGMYKFLSGTYSLNWQNRWEATPFMKESIKDEKEEPVSGHVLATMEIWFHLRRICPSLDSAVDSMKVYEILLNHDVGESHVGDTSIYNRVHGAGDNKNSERDTLEKLSIGLSDSGKELLDWFDELEDDTENIKSTEIMIAKWIDSLQGDHYGLVFGNDLPENSELIDKVLQIRFIPYTNRLIDLLKKGGKEGAVDEVKRVAKHHVELIKESGIDFDDSTLML